MHRLRITALLVAACLSGGVTTVAIAGDDNSGRGRGGDDTTGTTEDSTTGTTGTGTTGTGTTGTGTTGTGTTPTPGPARAPRIEEIEVDLVSGGRLRLRTELEARGARVTRVTFTYRGRRYRARRGSSNTWTRVVRARGGDGNDDVIPFRVRAGAGSRCATGRNRDDA
jgi:hypothetical protein